MKSLETIRKNMAAMGFVPTQQQNNHREFSSRQFFCTAKLSIDVIGIAAYMFFEADRTEDFVEPIFAITALGGITIVFVSLVFKNDKLFDTFEHSSAEMTISNLLSNVIICTTIFFPPKLI